MGWIWDEENMDFIYCKRCNKFYARNEFDRYCSKCWGKVKPIERHLTAPKDWLPPEPIIPS